MPSFTVQIEDTSPVLEYTSNWRPGTSLDDSSLDKYSQNTFMVSQSQGANVIIVFNGTGLSWIGANRQNHGTYSVNVDGTESSLKNGSTPSNEFNQTLFAATGLAQGSHTVKFTNVQGNFLDIDYVLATMPIGSDTEELIVNSLEDNHPAFVYTPSTSWYTPGTVTSFSGASGHGSQDPSASVEITFERSPGRSGDGIFVYGPVGPLQTTSYFASIDNGPISTFSASVQKAYRPQQLMYFATNLGGGNHTLNIKQGGLGELAIDYVEVYTTPSLGGSFNQTFSSVCPATSGNTSSMATPSSMAPGGTALSSSGPTPIPVGVLVALALTSTLALAQMVAFAYLYFKHYRAVKTAYAPEPTQVQPFHTTTFGPSPVAYPVRYAAPAQQWSHSEETTSPSGFPSSSTAGHRSVTTASSVIERRPMTEFRPPDYDDP